jgi:hypothetical protein
VGGGGAVGGRGGRVKSRPVGARGAGWQREMAAVRRRLLGPSVGRTLPKPCPPCTSLHESAGDPARREPARPPCPLSFCISVLDSSTGNALMMGPPEPHRVDKPADDGGRHHGAHTDERNCGGGGARFCAAGAGHADDRRVCECVFVFVFFWGGGGGGGRRQRFCATGAGGCRREQRGMLAFPVEARAGGGGGTGQRGAGLAAAPKEAAPSPNPQPGRRVASIQVY